MTMPAFAVAVQGYIDAHAPATDSGITDDDFMAALADEMAAGRA